MAGNTGTITSDGDTITVTLSRRAYSRSCASPTCADTAVPWWLNHHLRFQFS